MEFSKYQKEVFNFVNNGNGNAVVSAVAGSGKTTTIVNAAKLVPSNKKVLFLAFNKNIVEELSQRLQSCYNVKCSTSHAHGLQAIKKVYKYVRVFNGNRFFKEVTQCSVTESEILSVDSQQSLIYAFNKNSLKLLDLCRINLVKNGDIESIEKLADMYNIETVADEVNFVNKLLLKAYIFDTKTKTIDFTDMLTLPLTKEFIKFIPKYDFIFVDECQDLSKAQRELMLHSLKPNGRFIAVGDRKQAINGFAGASCDSFDLLANIDNTKELPLSVNYRCGRSIIEMVKDIVPEIKPFENAIDGNVNYVKDFKGLIGGDMILCRVTAPLVSLCLALWKNGIKAYVKGNDIAEGLINLVLKQKVKTVSDLFRRFEIEKDNLEKQLIAKKIKEPKNASKYILLCDKIECIEAIAETNKTNSINELLEKMKSLFSDVKDNEKVCLSTIHKAKGLETDTAWIIIPEKLPLRFDGQKDWEYQQELNLKYVAYTRAKKTLNIVDLSQKELLKLFNK